jgi:hypothetical protein
LGEAREKANISKHEYTVIQSSQFSFWNGELQLSKLHKTCPFVGRECLDEGCMAWRQGDCGLISRSGILSPFELKLQDAAPLMYRSLLDLVRILEESSKDCGKCGPDLWNYAQQIRAGLLNELIGAELAGAGIRAVERDAE